MLGRDSTNVIPGVGDFSFLLHHPLRWSGGCTNKLAVTINIDVAVFDCKVISKLRFLLALAAEAHFITELACEPSLVITGETLAKTHLYFKIIFRQLLFFILLIINL